MFPNQTIQDLKPFHQFGAKMPPPATPNKPVNHSSLCQISPTSSTNAGQLPPPIGSAAAPREDRHGTGKRVFRNHQQHPRSGYHRRLSLGQTDLGVRLLLQHIAAGDAIEHFGGERQVGNVGHHETRPAALQSIPDRRSISCQQSEQVSSAPGSAGIERLANVARPLPTSREFPQRPRGDQFPTPKQTLAHRRMQRKQAARGQHRPLGAIINIANLLPISSKLTRRIRSFSRIRLMNFRRGRSRPASCRTARPY